MRNQQAPIPRENVFYPEIEPLCCHNAAGARYLPGKGDMCIIAAGRGPPTSPSTHLQDSAPSHPEAQQDCTTRDKTFIAQPVFAPEKKERPFKRQVGDLVPKAELGSCASPEKRLRSSSFTCRPAETGNGILDKRVRSSSFSFLTAFPPNQPALKNNVFMPPTLLQEPPKQCSADSGLYSWTVMKPATLQPPQVTGCKDSEETESGTGVTRCQLEHKVITEKNSTLGNNAGHPKSPTGSAYILAMETRMQPSEQMFVPHKYKADFVFGENMEKRVMISKSPTSAPQCKRESTSTRGSCNRNWPYPKHRSHKSLIESAAAYTSRPRQKYELDQVEVITGEESERNVLQVNCKLFLFNKENQSWTERGRGYLRLNDVASSGIGPFRSRIVACCTRYRLSMVGKCGPLAAENSCQVAGKRWQHKGESCEITET
ncbi:ran-binding protein 3-like isoform X2 [Pseudophryne corroboree]|uniref:ran-binding protein 3-like isoform X2 n=1 Tax=Pseudophryne corroboree TaxID=495146 RepID=UPI0030818E80